MGRVRCCGRRCHEAKGTRCRCWCDGFLHGSGGAINRSALVSGLTRIEERPGYRNGECRYVEQQKLALEVQEVR